MMMRFRDMQVAEDIGKKAALGWFDVEFTMYGCAYLEAGQRYYKISPEAGDIYDFMERSVLKDIYASNVLCLTQKLAVPAGMKEKIALEVKKDLAGQLQKTYPQEFLLALSQLAEACRTNDAAATLWAEAETLEGVFEEEKLRRFKALLNYCYSMRKLSKGTYQEIEGWLKEERKSMEEDGTIKDIFEKTLYGFAYEEDGEINYLENANKSSIYRAIHEQESKGFLVTPVLVKTYWYNYKYCMSDVKADFACLLEQEYNKGYLKQLRKLKEGTGRILPAGLANTFSKLQEKWGNEPAATMLRYAHRWGIC